MRRKGILTFDFLVHFLGLLFSVLSVGALYRFYIRPQAEDIEITSMLTSLQNPDEPFALRRALAVILENNEQQACLTLMVWGCIIIGYKLLLLRGEAAMERIKYIKIERGERILPETAMGHYDRVGRMIQKSPIMRFKVLPDVVLAALHRFEATRSIQGAVEAVRDRVQMAYDRLDSDLSLIRYISWAIPSVGFIGTVRGIGEALAQAEQALEGDISGVTSSLALAFNSTLIALVLSVVLMYLIHVLQSRQEALMVGMEDFVNRRVVAYLKLPH